MKAVITVLGQDKVGIIASVSKVLSECNANILDISRTTMEGLFTMIMYVEISNLNVEFSVLSDILEKTGQELEMVIRIQHEDLFRTMHRV